MLSGPGSRVALRHEASQSDVQGRNGEYSRKLFALARLLNSPGIFWTLLWPLADVSDVTRASIGLYKLTELGTQQAGPLVTVNGAEAMRAPVRFLRRSSEHAIGRRQRCRQKLSSMFISFLHKPRSLDHSLLIHSQILKQSTFGRLGFNPGAFSLSQPGGLASASPLAGP